MKKQNINSGFTLIEILLAITIFAVVVSTLFGSFNIIISSVDPINAGMYDYQMARTAMDRIKKDLISICLTNDSIYTPPDIYDTKNHQDRFRVMDETVSLGDNSFSQLRFASFEHITFNHNKKGRIGIIRYYVDASEDGAENSSFVLKRSDIGLIFYDKTKKYNTKNDPLLCERVKAFKLVFIDQDGKPHEDWDSDSSDFGFATPSAITIKLEIGDEKISNIFTTTIILPVHRDKKE